MPSRRHQLLAAGHPAVAREQRPRLPSPRSAPASSPGTSPSTATLPTRAVRGFDRRWAVHGRGSTGSPRTCSRPATSSPSARSLPARRRLHVPASTASTSATPPGWPVRCGRASCCPTIRWPPSTPGATPTTRWSRTPPAGPASPAAPCWPATPPAAASRWRWRCRCATAAHAPATHLVLHAPWVDLTTSAPETAEFADARPLAVPRQAARVRRLVGRLRGGPGPPGGLPGLGRPDGPAAPPCLRHPRPARPPAAALLATRAAEARWDLTWVEEPDLIHVYGILPSCPSRGERSARSWSSCREDLGAGRPQ